MALLKEIMSGYFEEQDTFKVPFSTPAGLPQTPPIIVSKCAWEIVSDPNRLMREFEFEDYRTQKAFIDELLQYQEQTQHHAKITLDYRKVIIEVYTHDVNDVTELDIEYTRMADAILVDVQDYFLD